MTLDDLVESFREFADDLVEPYLWSSSQVESYADQAEIEACSRRPLLTSSTDDTLCSIPVLANQDRYTKHDAIREVFYVRLTTPTDSYPLRVTNVDELTFLDRDWPSAEGKPRYLILDDSSMTISPAPSEDGVLGLSVSHVPIIPASSTQKLSISAAHHYNLVYWMLHLAFQKQDSDTYNAKKSLEFGERFNNYFGDQKGVNLLKSVRTVRDDRDRGGWI